MKLKKQNIKFSDKDAIFDLFGYLHDARFKFYLINEFKIGVICQTLEEYAKEEIHINLKESAYYTTLIYEVTDIRRKFKGKIIDTNFRKDLESLNVQFFECMCTREDLILEMAIELPHRYGNNIYIEFRAVESIDVFK